MFNRIIAVVMASMTPAACAYPAVSEPPPVDVSVDMDKAVPIEVVKKTWKCVDCTTEEQYVLMKLQEGTKISDRNALATIMGNIKQESKFIPNICEGGARVTYSNCHTGGYGLIQWTSVGRYAGLGSFCNKYNCDPSSLEGQVRYMINEPIFQKILPEFEGPGRTVSQYMVPAYYWLGWGIKGNREVYAYDYTKKLILA
ncbi:MAG: phage tail tip lysozyme [Pelagibacteraceae bacterium]